MSLELDVCGEACAELVQLLKRRRGGEAIRVAPNQHVLQERTDDRGVPGLAVGGIGGEQKLFLEAEVLLLFCIPMGEERAGGFGGVLCGRVAQPAGDHEHVVVVAREGHERRVALHDAAGSTPRSASASTQNVNTLATAAVSADVGT